MHDAAGRQEEQGLEEGVGEQVEDARGHHAASQGEEHVTELTDRRVSQHALEVVLRQGDESPEQGGEATDGCHDELYFVYLHKQRRAAGHQVHAGGHHGGGMDQGADRRGTFHGVGQPHVQRKLGRFADSPAEKQQAGGTHQEGIAVREFGENGVEVEGKSRLAPQKDDSQQHADVAQTGHQEGLRAAAAAAGFWNQKPISR